jgi:hypothetical protein
MPNWFGPVLAATVTVTLTMMGAFSWLIRYFIEAQIERGVRKAVDTLQREANDRFSRIDSHFSKIEGDIRELRTQRQGDIELMNVKLGQITNNHDRYERHSDQRIYDLEQIVGRARSLLEKKE